MRRFITLLICVAFLATPSTQHRYKAKDGTLRVALAQQPLGPNGSSKGPDTMAHGNKVPNGPASDQLEKLFEEIFRRYPKASAIGFATIPPTDEGGLSIAALNRMIAGAVRGVTARQ